MGNDSEDDKEIDVTIAGQHVRTKGYRQMDLIWLPLVMGVGYSAFGIYQHEATAQTETRTIAQSVKEANQEIVRQLKENNLQVVESMKTLTNEMKKSTAAQKETACLLNPAMKNRPDAREACRSILRDDR